MRVQAIDLEFAAAEPSGYVVRPVERAGEQDEIFAIIEGRKHTAGAGLKFSWEIRFFASKVRIFGGWQPRGLSAVVVGRSGWWMIVARRNARRTPREKCFVKVHVGGGDETIGRRYPNVVGSGHVACASGVYANPSAWLKARLGV